MESTVIPESLKHRLRRGEIVPFVGAGVSRAVLRPDGQPLFPGWRDLLLHAADRLDKEGKGADSQLVQSLMGIKPPDYLEAARRAKNGLGPLWLTFLKEEIDQRFEEADPKSLALANAVWALGNPLVVTTNYDMVLQWACPESLTKNLDFWDVEAKVEQGHFLRSGRPERPTVWHLHGRIGNASQLILTPDGYKHLYENSSKGHYEAALKTLQALLVSRSLLFVGFSFEDDALGVQLQTMNELFAGAPGPHYALVHTQDLDRLSALKLPIKLIPFVDFGEPLLNLLQELGEIANNASLASQSSLPSLDPLPPGASYSTDNAPFFVPFRAKGDRVIGAEQALQRVHDQLTQGRPTSIGQTAAFQGLGGLGKTQLAVEYAWHFKDQYRNGVIWLTADQDIPAQLTRLAVEAKWVASESEHKVKLDIAQHRVRSYSDCLIVFDNVEDLATIEPYLPLASAQPHLLATSRNEQPGFIPVELDLLDEDQSLALLTSEAGRLPTNKEEEEAAREVARELGGLPLALEMAGTYLLRRSIRWEQYRSLLRSNPRAALRPELLVSFTRHEADIFATLRIQEGLFENEPFLREVLNILTWSGSAPMGLSLLAAILGVQEADLLGALSLGVQLRLFEHSSGADRYSLHRLVRKVRQADRPLINDSNWVEEVCHRLGNWFFARRQDFADLATFEAEIDHLEKWRAQAQARGNAQASRLTWLLAYPPFHRGQYAESHRWLDQARSLFESEANLDQELSAWLWTDLGTITAQEGHEKEALELYKIGLAIRRKVLGEEHSDTVTSISNISAAHKRCGNLDIAFEYENQALAIQRKVLGEEHPDTATSLANLSQIYIDRGDLDTALEYENQALAIRYKILGEEHPDTATSLSDIAYVYIERGDLDKALDFENQALAIRRKMLGEGHPDTAMSLANLSHIYSERGELDTALEYATQAFVIQRKVLGETHPDMAMPISILGHLCSERGDLDAALDFENQALAIRCKALGEEHPDTATSLSDIAFIYSERGDWDKALDLENQALAIRRKALGEEHPNTATSLSDIAAIYITRGDLGKALNFESQALTIRRKVFGEEHPDTATSLSDIAFIYSELGDLNKALDLENQALAIRRKVLGEGHSDTAMSLNSIRDLSFKGVEPRKTI